MITKLLFRCVIVCVSLFAASANAGYWTVPINYYKLEHLRYPMAYLEEAQSDIYPNMGQKLPFNKYQATSINAFGMNDPVRGLVTSYYIGGRSGYTGYTQHQYPSSKVGQNATEASLSVWIRLVDPQLPNEMLLARGNVTNGFSLYMQDQKLRFAFWNQLSRTGPDKGVWRGGMASQSSLDPNKWHNIVITQSIRDKRSYVALYINGILEAQLSDPTGSPPSLPTGSGLLAGTSDIVTFGVIGGASTSGWVWSGKDGSPKSYASYARKIDDMQEFWAGDIAFYPYARDAEFSDFRYFGGIELVCTDKTAADFAKKNRTVQVGTRCDVASDVNSIAQDRIEQGGYLARIPLKYDFSDHNYEGLNKPNNFRITCTDKQKACPRNEPDLVRQSALNPRMGSLWYRGPSKDLDVGRFEPPYSVSIWIKEATNPSVKRSIYAVRGAISSLQINMEESEEDMDRLVVEMQAPDGKETKISSSVGFPLSDRGNWHHIAVSLDAPANGAEAPSGISLFYDGTLVGSDSLIYWNKDGDAGLSPEQDPGQFRGKISDLQVVAMPLSLPQARALASRFPNAYSPVYDLVDYPYEWKKPQRISNPVPNYTYLDAIPTKPVTYADSTYTYDSANVAFTFDWSKPGQPWIDPTTNKSPVECEYVLGGLQYFWERSPGDAAETASTLLCFSPQKLQYNMPPFSLALYYQEYGRYLYLPVLDVMLSPQIVQALRGYSSAAGVAGITTSFNLTIGRYNTILQAQTAAPKLLAEKPNYISPIYQGANKLLNELFQYLGKDAKSGVTVLYPIDAVSSVVLKYVDQKQLLDDIDMKLSKDR